MSEEAFLDDLATILEVDTAELHEEFILDKSNWDSLAIVTVIVLIDEQYGITIEGDKLRECSSIAALLQLINDTNSC